MSPRAAIAAANVEHLNNLLPYVIANVLGMTLKGLNPIQSNPMNPPKTIQETIDFIALLNSLPSADRDEMLAACGYRSLSISVSPTLPPSK